MPHFWGFGFGKCEKSGVLEGGKDGSILAIEGQKNFIEMRRFGLFVTGLNIVPLRELKRSLYEFDNFCYRYN